MKVRLAKVVHCVTLLLAVFACNPANAFQRDSAADLVKSLEKKNDALERRLDALQDELRVELAKVATKQQLQNLRKEANATASEMRIVEFVGGGVAFVLGILVNHLAARFFKAKPEK
jgi:hypothetical protein